ncbi:MAG: acyl-CoA desaturase [Verrucomicrobiales bacterium]|nr:acyl-CoA desaturase [Verrucomicrobiales bacterium]
MDSQATQKKVELPDQSDGVSSMKIDPKRVLPYIFIHGGCLAVIWVGWSWFAVAAAVFLYVVRMFAITAFYHRYFSHRAFKANRLMQFIFAVWGHTSMQGGALWWAANHRHHHNHSDETHDKHSPVQSGFWFAHIGWLFYPENFSTDYQKVKDYAKFPELVFLNRYDYIVPLAYGAMLLGLGALLESYFPGLGTNAWQLFVWGFFISTVVLLHGTLFINSLAHVWGSRRFETEDDSRNNFLLALITLGEGWHNNHHRYQHSAQQGFYWFEVDLSYYALRAMEKLGLIYDLKPVPARIYDEAGQQKKARIGK